MILIGFVIMILSNHSYIPLDTTIYNDIDSCTSTLNYIHLIHPDYIMQCAEVRRDILKR